MRKFILLTKLLTLILTDVFTNSNATNEPTLVQPFNFTVFDNVKNFTKIGTIKSTSNATIQYFIVSVESTLEDEFFRKPNWKSITLNGSLIDCMQLVLYDIPRSHFCIDHKTGELYTTPEFSRTKPRVNTTYKITIRAQLNREMFTDQVYNVLVMSECDQITISYNKIPKTNCDNNKMLQLKDISRNTTKVSTFSHRYFVEGVKFYFITSLTVDMTKETAPEAGTTTIYILLKYHHTAQNVSFVFQTSQKYYIDLTPIFDVKSPIIIQVELTFFYTDLTGRKINGPYRLNQNLFTFHGFEALNDYCAHSYGNCISSTENYLQTVKKLSHCKRHIDENLYGLKYGNCNGSKLPNVFNTTLELDLPREQMIKIVDGTFIGKGNSYAYNLIRVTGAQDGDFGSGFPRPNECTSEEVYTSPGHFFCINNMDGTIYTTASADNHLKSNDTFLFQMEATTKTLPFRKKRFTLKLTIADLCSPGSQHYTDLITQCSGILLSKPTESLLFPTNELIKAILGVRVDASLILLESRSVIIQASVHAINFTKNFTHTIQRYSGQRYYYFSVQDFVFDGKAGNNVRFQIYQASENNFKKIKNIAKDQLAMVYVSNWRSCDLERCLNWYRSWKTGLTLFKDDYRCTEDYRFAGLYYERCLDLEPHFLNGPYAELTIIDGCKYKSVVNLNKYAFYLLNNVTRINITEGKRRRRRRRNAANDPNLLTYDFPRLVLNDFRQQGDIQCALYDIKRMSQPVLSASRKVKFTDPSFLGQPRSLNGTAGLSLSVPGCSLQTEVKLNIRDMFHLRNGTERINLTSSIVRSSNFPRFNFSKLTFADAGSYQCAIFVPGFMEAPITSSPFNITVKELNVTLDGTLKLLLRDNGIYILEGCSFRAKKKLNNYTYILYNGNIRRNLTITSSGNKHTFTGYTINNYEQAGSYQCIIYDPSAMKAPLKSNIVSTNFTVPKFTSNPQPERIPTFAGESMRIIGCGIETDLPLNGSQLYWKKIYNRSTTRLPAPIHSRVMPSFSTIKAKLTDQGTYQCALFIKSLMSSPVLSELTITVSFTALNARFLTQPKIDHTKGLPVVYGCSYHSQRNLASALYYRLNETTRITVIPTNPEEEKFSDKGFDRTRQFSTTGDNLTYNFPNLTIGDYRSIGKYECYIFDPDTMRKEVISTPTAMVTLPAPTFHKAPEYIGRPPKKVGDWLRVGACEFSSVSKSIPISRIYWLKDGFQRIDLGDIKRVQHATGSMYMFPSRDYEISDNSTQGYFQCVVHIPELGVEVKSQKINVQFEDVSDTRVVVRIDQTFTPALLNSSSLEYVALKKKVESQVRVALQNLGATSNNQIVEVIGFSKGSVNAVTKVRFVKISSTTRLNYCDSLKGLVVEPSKDLNVLSVKVNSLDCCFENETGEDSFKGVYHYNKTLVNNTDSQIQKQCRYSTGKSYRVCKRDLELGPQWSDVDLRKCLAESVTTQNLEILSQVAVCNVTITTNCSSVDEVAANLSAIVSNGSVITTQQDVTYIANTIKNLVNNIQNALNTEIANDIVKTVSNVLDANVAIVAKAQFNTKSSTSILNDLDELARKLGKLLKTGGKLVSINADQPNVALNVRYLERGNITIYSQQSNENVRIFITSNTSIPTNIWSSLRVPDVTFPAMKEVLFSYFFRQNSLFLTEEEILKSIYNQSNLTRLIQSTILAGTLGDKHITNLTNPILLKFDKTYYVNEEGKSSCEFWDFTKGSLGSWSSEGCKRINESDDKFITCECTHLTNFAILLDPSQTGSNPIELQIITWIGCGLSLAGLLLTLITFLAFQNLRKKLPPKILICLCFSLLILLIVFLAGVEQTDSDGGCKAVAVLIHYFTLSTFCWMAVEGLNLYRCFVKIFKKGSATKFLKKASLFAWGLPAVIVIVTAAAKPDNLGNDDFCIVAGYSFYFGVLVPVATILLSNFIVLGLVMRGLSTNVMNRSNDNEENRILRQARVAFACATLLGLTWVFGLLAVGKATTFFQWLFCIFNSLQGFFIFLFYTVRNTDVRKEWARCLGISIKGDSTLSTGTDRHEMEKRGEDHHNLTSGVTATTSG